MATLGVIALGISGVKASIAVHKYRQARIAQKAEGGISPKVAQIDEVFLVQSILGENLIALGTINVNCLPAAHAAVTQAFDSCNEDEIAKQFKALDPELQFIICTGMFLCATCWPMHIYRGFGAASFADWTWGCPDMKYLESLAKVGLFQKKKVVQANFDILAAFDRAVAFLQNSLTGVPLLIRQPGGLHRSRPIFANTDKKDAKKDLSVLQDYTKVIEKRGHPSPRDGSLKASNWTIPFATWQSPFNYENQGHSWVNVINNQMDPGRILHAFVCGGHLDLEEGELLVLPPASPAEQIARWLEGFTGMTFKIIEWKELESEVFEKALSKSTRKLIGQSPLPNYFAVRDPIAVRRRALQRQKSAPMTLQHIASQSSAGSPVLPPPTPDFPSAMSSPALGTPSTPSNAFGGPINGFPFASVPTSPHLSRRPTPGQTLGPSSPHAGGETGVQAATAVGKLAWEVGSTLTGIN